jgi:hypothetical protein
MTTPTIKVGETVKFRNAEYKLVTMNLGGKCKIKKLHLPNKGKVLIEIDINELKP